MTVYKLIPVAFMTRLAKKAAEVQIPHFLRSPVDRIYSWVFGCNLEETAPLNSFPTFNKFFTRSLCDGVRPI